MHFSVQIPKTGHHDATLLFFRCSKCGRAATETRVSQPVAQAEPHTKLSGEVYDSIKLRER